MIDKTNMQGVMNVIRQAELASRVSKIFSFRQYEEEVIFDVEKITEIGGSQSSLHEHGRAVCGKPADVEGKLRPGRPQQAEEYCGFD